MTILVTVEVEDMTLETYDSFQWYDYVIFTVTLLISLGIGVYYAMTGGKQRTTKEFHMADRKMGVLPIALSLFMSTMSGEKLISGHLV